jgi:repressor LexA
MTALTPAQRRLLGFLEAQIADTGISPTYDEISRALGMRSRSQVHAMLRCLRERRAIEWTPGRSRSIRLIEDTERGHLRVVAAARALLDGITTEEIDQIGTATLSVRAELLGELDLALAEME